MWGLIPSTSEPRQWILFLEVPWTIISQSVLLVGGPNQAQRFCTQDQSTDKQFQMSTDMGHNVSSDIYMQNNAHHQQRNTESCWWPPCLNNV